MNWKSLVLITAALVPTCAIPFLQMRSDAQERGDRLGASNSVVAVSVDVENPVAARFGDPLRLHVTLYNTGSAPIAFRPGSFSLKMDAWSSRGKMGSGLGNYPLIDDTGKPRVLSAGQSLTLGGTNDDLTVMALGPMKASFFLVTDDSTVAPLLPTKEKFNIRFDVTPSDLMSSVWTARTQAERDKLQPRIRELLLLRSRLKDSTGWRDRNFVDNTFKYLGGYVFTMLDAAFRDADPIVREQAVGVYPDAVWAVGNLNFYIDELSKNQPGVAWVLGLTKGDKDAAEQSCVRLAIAGLSDSSPRVRVRSLEVLTTREAEQAADAVKPLARDPDPDVRSAVQAYLSRFAGASDSADAVVASLGDADPTVRKQAIIALEKSPKPPPISSLKHAFSTAKGDTALPLIELLFEQEDATLPSTLGKDFEQRSSKERLAIMTVIAGHRDAGALDLLKLGLQDTSADVQRAALMRLLAFPAATAMPVLEAFSAKASASLPDIADSVKTEINNRRLWPFLRGESDDPAAAHEVMFPSHNGTVPMVSPDGQWVAYVETGWGRPGGSGGMGRSNLTSLVHAVRADGSDDRLVADMFLVSWLSDSKHIASARDGFASICDLEATVTAEFGAPLDAKWAKSYARRVDWTKGHPRHQGGDSMPHSKRLEGLGDFEWGEDAAFSPNGKWFGPLRSNGEAVFIDSTGERLKIKLSGDAGFAGQQATWSPDGKHIVVVGAGGSQATVIDFQNRSSAAVKMDAIPKIESWNYRKSRWNPWSRDGSWLAFVRQGQIWISKPDGADAKQLTFDATRKAFPTFSRNGKQIAYVSWQTNDRLHYTRLGPTDLWIVDVGTTLVTRATLPSDERIHCLDWLDDYSLIFDRLDSEGMGRKSSLRQLSLVQGR